MSISGIGLTTPVWPTQNNSGVNATTNSDRDGDNDGSRISGTGGGAFMQDVMQSLQSLGLSLSGTNTNNTSSASSSIQSSSATSTNVNQALHTFLHDLHQAINQSGGAQQQSSAVDSDGDNDGSGPLSSGAQNGYGNFATNLQSLIGSINNTNGTSGSSSPDNTLQTDFSNLINAIGGTSSSSTPTLQDFLNKMEGNANNSSTAKNGVGSIFSAQA